MIHTCCRINLICCCLLSLSFQGHFFSCLCDYYSFLHAALYLDKLEDIKEPVQTAPCQWFFFSIIFISPIVPAIFINEWGCRSCLGSETLRREKDDHIREVAPLITSSICHYLYCSNLFQGWLQISWINLIEYNKGSWTLTCEGIFFFHIQFNLSVVLGFF